MHIPIDIEPQPLLAHEAAGFVQAVCATTASVARDEFHHGMVCIRLVVLPDGEPDPLWLIVGALLECRGPGRVMPGGEHIGIVAERIGGVAAAHQRLRVRGMCLASQQGLATGAERFARFARAGWVCRCGA